MMKICEHTKCDNDISHKPPKSRFCSKYCWGRDYYLKNKEIIIRACAAKDCNKDIRHKTRRAQFCSEKCLRRSNIQSNRKRASIWQKENKARANSNSARRRARKRQACPNWLTEEQHGQIQDYYEVAQLLDLTVDHIVPLRGKNVCGLHVPWNLDFLTHAENSAKGNRFG